MKNLHEMGQFIIDHYQESNCYKYAYSDFTGGKEIIIKSRVRIPKNMIEDLAKYEDINPEAELFSLIVQQFTAEAMMAIVHDCQEIQNIKISQLQELIKEETHNTIMCSPNVIPNIIDELKLYCEEHNPIGYMLEKIGELFDKSIMCNPYLINGVVYAYNYKNMGFKVEIDKKRSTEDEIKFLININYDSDINAYNIEDLEKW